METNQVTEHLQVIRTLMERSALYRRALAPIMIYCGAVGISGGIAGWQLKIKSDSSFVLFWNLAAVVALTGSFLLVRRQALKDAEPFWSAPTKRVTQAMLPPLAIGAVIGFLVWISESNDEVNHELLVIAWACLYGCALHSAGFVVSRGFRLFAWIFMILGCLLMIASMSRTFVFRQEPHILMGGLFGGLHFVYGIYLYFTESKKTSP